MAEVRPIDANALKDAFNTDVQTAMFSWNTDLLQGLMIEIDEAPTLDYGPVRHGEWYDGAFNNSKCCSVCGKYATKVKAHNQPVFDYVYCPNCGAKMDGGGSHD